MSGITKPEIKEIKEEEYKPKQHSMFTKVLLGFLILMFVLSSFM